MKNNKTLLLFFVRYFVYFKKLKNGFNFLIKKLLFVTDFLNNY